MSSQRAENTATAVGYFEPYATGNYRGQNCSMYLIKCNGYSSCVLFMGMVSLDLNRKYEVSGKVVVAKDFNVNLYKVVCIEVSSFTELDISEEESEIFDSGDKRNIFDMRIDNSYAYAIMDIAIVDTPSLMPNGCIVFKGLFNRDQRMKTVIWKDAKENSDITVDALVGSIKAKVHCGVTLKHGEDEHKVLSALLVSELL